MYKIKSLTPTYLKKSVKQANLLDSSEKTFRKEGTEFFVDQYKIAEKGHYQVQLSYGAGNWFLFGQHWDLPWEDSEETQDSVLTEKHKEELRPVPLLSTLDIDWYDPNSRVSEYFRVFEVTQGDYRRIPKDLETRKNIILLARKLDKVRERWADTEDRPAIAVTSWYRPPAINHRVGGVPNSQHITGKAVDVFPVNGKIFAFQSFLDQVAWKDKALGYGARRGFVHLDLRNSPIRWNY